MVGLCSRSNLSALLLPRLHRRCRQVHRSFGPQKARASGRQVWGDSIRESRSTRPDGTCVRDYVHVNDLADAHVTALERLASGADSIAVNLGTGTGYSVKQVLDKIEQVTGRKVPVRIAPRREGDPPALVADASLAEKVLTWKATRTLDDIVTTAWKWMQKQNALSS